MTDVSLRPPRARPVRRTRPSRLASVIAVAVGLGLGAGLAGCGSDAGSESSSGDQASTTELCDAVKDYAEADAAGDPTAMAGALDGLVGRAPESIAADLSAYIDDLESSPANQAPEADGVEGDSSAESFRAYVTERCGADALEAGGTSAGAGAATSSTSSSTIPTSRPDAASTTTTPPTSAPGTGSSVPASSTPDQGAGDSGNTPGGTDDADTDPGDDESYPTGTDDSDR